MDVVLQLVAAPCATTNRWTDVRNEISGIRVPVASVDLCVHSTSAMLFGVCAALLACIGELAVLMHLSLIHI